MSVLRLLEVVFGLTAPLPAALPLPLVDLKDRALSWLLLCPSAHQYDAKIKENFAVQLLDDICTAWNIRPVLVLGFLLCALAAALLALASVFRRIIRCVSFIPLCSACQCRSLSLRITACNNFFPLQQAGATKAGYWCMNVCFLQ